MTFLNRHRSRIRPVGPFAPSSLFFGGIPGAWYDPTDLSTMFQDNTGLTPVTAVEQPVGLIFDKSQGTPTARYNLLTYSEQFNDAYWFKAGGTISANTTLAPDGTTTADTWTATAGAARHELLSGIGAGPTTTANANHTFTLYVKKGTHNFVSLLVTANNTTWYVATFDFSGATPVVSKTGAGAGGVLVSTSIEAAANGFWRLGVTGRTTDAVSVCCPVLASSATPTYGIYGEENWTAAGTETAIFWGAQLQVGSTATTYQRITTGTGGEWTPGNHASQSTAASRPTYRARYNLLTFSEQFNDAAWTKQNTTTSANTTVAPDGTTTADTLVETAALGIHVTYQTITGCTIGTRYTFTCYAKAAQRSYVALQIYNNVSNARFATLFDIVGGTVVTTRMTNAPTGTSSSITDAGNGWWRLQITMDQVGGTTNIPQIGLSDSASPVFAADMPQYLGDGTSGAFIWGAQLLTAADVTATGNAYQRIAAATVYDTAAVFRPYLAFDGMDDSLATAAINFSTTQKMTLFAGVTKNTDSSAGIIGELTASADANAGGFNFVATNAVGYYMQCGAPLDRVFGIGTSFTTAAPTTDVAAVSYDRTIASSVAQIQYRTDAQGPSSAGLVLQGVGASGAFANAAFFIGRRNNASIPFNGRLFSLIVRGAASSVTEIADTELWVNARTGAF